MQMKRLYEESHLVKTPEGDITGAIDGYGQMRQVGDRVGSGIIKQIFIAENDQDNGLESGGIRYMVRCDCGVRTIMDNQHLYESTNKYNNLRRDRNYSSGCGRWCPIFMRIDNWAEELPPRKRQYKKQKERKLPKKEE